jgi:hypothetical protein
MLIGIIILIVWMVYALALTFALARKALRSKKRAAVSGGLGNRLRILIIGATGGTGRQLVQQALDLGHQVTAFVRKPAKKMEHANLRVAQGNVLDYASVESAMQGQNAVLSALGHKRLFWPTKILSEGTCDILRAMKSRGVSRFIRESSLGVGDAVGRLGLPATFLFVPLILPFYFWDRLRQEDPATLTNGPARDDYRHGPKVGSYIVPKRVSRADVADFMLKQLTDDAYLGEATAVSW